MNPRQQGDFGERSALNWLIDQGASVYLPFGHSPDVDLVAWLDGRFVGIQVKTTGCFHKGRWVCSICTRGGNQSWSGLVKRFSADRCDYLFVHAADGRRWMIPSIEVGGGNAILLGGPKYDPFEVSRGEPFPLDEAA